MTREEILRTLRATAKTAMDLGAGLLPGQMTRRARDDEWSMVEILQHLIRGEREVVLPRLRRMLVEDGPVFVSSSASRTGFAAPPQSGDWSAALAAFRRVRADTLTFLDALAEAHWERKGTTPTCGTLTIEEYARYLAEHDLEHLAQMETTRAAVTGAPVPQRV
ncbi:MAG: DinB family protein [Candidatus Rokubacteria bacterium]|nr:DinB family protein [Candidatus Rokubacteria bacterium]MBI3825303.1 DinB family protein [Candidatus Rokubacteria bacterium]